MCNAIIVVLVLLSIYLIISLMLANNKIKNLENAIFETVNRQKNKDLVYEDEINRKDRTISNLIANQDKLESRIVALTSHNSRLKHEILSNGGKTCA